MDDICSAPFWSYAPPIQLPQRWANTGISRVVWVTRQSGRSGKPFQEQHCYLSKGMHDVTAFVQLIRQPWQIENGLHWVKDVTLQEDYPSQGYWFIFDENVFSFLAGLTHDSSATESARIHTG